MHALRETFGEPNNFCSVVGFSRIVKCSVFFCRFVLSNDNIKYGCGVLCFCYFCCFVLDFGSFCCCLFCFVLRVLTKRIYVYFCSYVIYWHFMFMSPTRVPNFSDSNSNTQTNNNRIKRMLKWTHFVLHVYFVCSFCPQY